MKNKKNIVFLSGTRADFGKLKSLIHVVDEHEDFNYEIFVTGMHLLKRYGETYLEVYKSGFKNVHKYINQHIDEPMEMILANTIHGFSRYVHEKQPDLIVIHGDRVEALAGAIVGSMNNILVAHIEGGERSGTIDELIRHSVTKLSHIHLVANQEAKKRIIQMGEDPKSVFIIGSPDIDIMKSDKLPKIEDVKKYYSISFDEYHVLMFHPVTTDADNFSEYAFNLVDAMIESGDNFVIIYPNNDSGTNHILNAYEKVKDNPNFAIFPSIRFEFFLTLIEHSKSLIGNSSAGIREAPIFGIPSINIGTRQNLRFKSSSIVDCDYSKNGILEAIQKINSGEFRHETCEYFGSGNSAEEFKKLISGDLIWQFELQKTFIDITDIIKDKSYEK
jgi:UDP-N-acetylglucosamine 2-epimerase (hydrolysing)